MKVAVTGGIGAGKSEFMRAVKELGIRTYSADEINAELLRDKRYIEKLSEAFPLAVKVIYRQADKSKFELKQCIENIDKVIKSLING